MNQVVLIGRTARDMELRYTAGGMAVAKFTLAVNRKMAKEGQQQADFISCTSFGKTAETLSKYVTKGQQLAIQGRLQISENGQGQEKKWFSEVVVEQFDFIGSKRKTENNESNSFGSEITFDEGDLPWVTN